MTDETQTLNLELRVVQSLHEVPAAQWDGLTSSGLDGPASAAHPFMSWTFLPGQKSVPSLVIGGQEPRLCPISP